MGKWGRDQSHPHRPKKRAWTSGPPTRPKRHHPRHSPTRTPARPHRSDKIHSDYAALSTPKVPETGCRRPGNRAGMAHRGPVTKPSVSRHRPARSPRWREPAWDCPGCASTRASPTQPKGVTLTAAGHHRAAFVYLCGRMSQANKAPTGGSLHPSSATSTDNCRRRPPGLRRAVDPPPRWVGHQRLGRIPAHQPLTSPRRRPHPVARARA